MGPAGTVLLTMALMSIFSAPCGYLTFIGQTWISGEPAAAFFMASIASGLFASIPTYPFFTPRILMRIFRPSMISRGLSSMRRWSEVRYGSHSAPFRMTTSMGFSLGGESFTNVGNVAPPMPTMPASWTIFFSSAGFNT